MAKQLNYGVLLLKRASQKSVLLTDQLTVLIVPFSTLALWAAGAKMTSTIQETLALGVAITVIAVVILRLMAASYLLWQEDQQEKESLKKALAAPERDIDISLKLYTTERRKLLSEKLALLCAIANYGPNSITFLKIDRETISATILDIETLINQLSYNIPVRISAIRLKEYCIDLINGNSVDKERLWEQRKLTFRLLHREDRISQFMTLVDIQMLTENDDYDMSEDILADLKKAIRDLGEKYYTPEVEAAMRAADRGGPHDLKS